VLQLCDGVVVASGTATLVVGMMGIPMVIIYRFHVLTALVAKLIVAKDQMFGLINVLLGRRAFPELFQENANPQKIMENVNQWTDRPDMYLEQRNSLKTINQLLGERGASKRVWKIIKDFLQ
jgi:lipid-A-disaccharide synthase